MLTETDRAPDAAARLIDAAHMIATKIIGTMPVQKKHINEAMIAAFGATSADGAWSQRDSFVMTEIAAILALRSVKLTGQPKATIEQLTNLENALPTQTVRSEDQVAHQHFSTPLYLAWHLAAIGDDDIILEPSAGTLNGQALSAARSRFESGKQRLGPLRETVSIARVEGRADRRANPKSWRWSAPPSRRAATPGNFRLAA